MAGEKKIEEFEPVVSGLKSDSSAKLPEKDMARRKVETSKAPIAEQGANCYKYYYPGYNGSVSQSNDQTSNGVEPDSGSRLYYIPSYNPYATGYVGGDVKQQSYASSGYHQQPRYSRDSAYAGDVKNGSMKSNGFNSSKANGNLSSRTPSLPLNSKARQFDASSNLSKSGFHAQPPSNFGSGYPSMGLVRGFYPVGKYSSYANQNGAYMHYPPMNYQTYGRDWNGNNKYRPKGQFSRNAESEASAELVRGPRANKTNSPKWNEQPEVTILKEKFNLEDFPTEYENAKFYVIKSYSEDDIHKCVKYDVWSSTPNGNKKLDSSYRDAEAKASETNTTCPIFLFFSVNGSGQFLGVAEMLGPVDFNKKMDFWQQDKWNGFFPVKWHIVKDVPTTQLRHIVLENNDLKPVTFSRDTQEVGLNHGLEMLSIFKSYTEKTSILDDFSFYEDRERLLKGRRGSKPASRTHDATKGPLVASEKMIGEEYVKTDHSDSSSLIDLTKNLSLNGSV